MTVLPIIRYPSDTLRTPSMEIEPDLLKDDATFELAIDMIETLRVSRGVGLSAVQVGAAVRLFVIAKHEVGATIDEGYAVFINPRITVSDGAREKKDEGCLSLPTVYLPIERAKKVTVTALDLDGVEFSVEVDGLYARAVQHEMDHLDGKVIADYFGSARREMVRKQVSKAK